MQRLRLKMRVFVAALAAMVAVQVAAPSLAHAQNWDVRGGSKRHQEIVRRYKQLLEHNPVEGLIFKKLVSYVGRGDGLDSLIEDYKKAVKDHPNKVTYHLILGHLLKVKSEYKAALAQYDRAVELDKQNPTAWLSRGSAHMLLNHDKQATQDFEKALSLEKNKDRKQKILRKLADVAFAQHDWDRAEKYYDKLVDLDPRDEYLRMEYAQVLVKYKRYDKALKQYDALIRLAGHDTKKRATTLRDKGDVYERMGEPEKAVATYRKAMRLMREGNWLHDELRHRIVDVYRSMDKLDELVEQYQKKWHHPNYDQSMTLAKLYDELGQDDKALTYFRRAVAKNRHKVDPRLALIRILQRRGDDDKVVDAYKSLIRVAPGQERFQFDLVQLYFRLGERKTAERELAHIARRFRRDPQVYQQLANTYMRYDMRQKARKAYQRLVRLDPRNESYILSLGEFYYRSSELDKAKKTWKKLIHSRLSKPQAYSLMGDTFAEHGLIEEGLRYYEKAVKLAPDDLKIRRGVARNYVRARRWDKAIAAWRYVLDHSKQAQARAEARGRIIDIFEQRGLLRSKMRDYEKAFAADKPDAEAGYFLAEAHLKRKEYAQAEKVYQKLIDLDGKEDKSDLDALQALLRIYQQTSEPKKAIAVLEKMAKLRPRLAQQFYHQIAEISLDLYQDDKAIKYAMRAVEQNPDDATAHAQLGDVYREMQRTEEAVKQYKQAIDLDPRSFDHYWKLAELDLQLGKYDAAEKLYRAIVTKSDDESLIIKAGRKAMKLAEADGRLGDLEMEFSPLLFGARSKPVYRKLLLEIYDRMASPLVEELRYGIGKDHATTEKKLVALSRKALPALTDALQSNDVAQRAAAIGLLGDLRAGAAAPALAHIGVDRTDSLRTMALIAVARIGDERASAALVGALDDEDPGVRDMATWALGFTGGRRAVKALVDVVKKGQNWTQKALAAISLGRIGTAKASRALLDALEPDRLSHSSDNTAVALVWALGRAGSDKAVPALEKALDTGSAEVRDVAAWSLARVGNDAAFKALLDAYWSDEPLLRQAGARGLVQMAGRDPHQDEKATAAREAAHDIQYIDDRRQQIQTDSIISSLQQDARAIDVTRSGDFIAPHLDTIAKLANDRLGGDNERVRRIVLRDLADMAGRLGFGILTPTTKADEQAVDTLLARLHPQLAKLAQSDKPAILRPAVLLLGAAGDSADEPRLLELAGAKDPGVREAAIDALGHAKPASSQAADKIVAALRHALADPAFGVRAAAARSLGALVGPKDAHAAKATAALLELLGDDFRAVREAAAQGLVALGSDEAITGLSARLGDLALPVRLVALRALASSKTDAARKALAPFRKNDDIRIRQAAGGE